MKKRINQSHLGIVTAVIASITMLLTSCGEEKTSPQPAKGPASIDAARLIGANAEPENWMGHARTYDEQRFSPLTEISDQNIAKLGLAWSVDLPTFRGLEASPLVIDGIMYTTTNWSIIFAYDAKTGKELWSYDPQVPKEKGFHACCDVVNRGLAAWNGKLYIGALDGRLIAVDAATGKEVWSTQTFPYESARTITGAPRIVKGKVLIGHGGAEYGVRGYLSAYDAETGEMSWRFYTVPGNPADGFEDETQENIAKTWNGNWWAFGGGGGTVWDSMAYDPELDLLYIGVGNGSPWNQEVRSPGGGDNLFLSSIVALSPDTGEYVWHYQTTPGDTWDYTATQHIILADMEIEGVARKVLMQAPKNGFFYVIDRASGELLSAEKFSTMTWASHVDMKTGRPVELPGARYYDPEQTKYLPAMHLPGTLGAHNWHPMAYNPITGLVYIPAQDIGANFVPTNDAVYKEGGWNTGTDFSKTPTPQDPAIIREIRKFMQGRILAWDPKTGKEVWRVEHNTPWNGGMLTTAGNLLFQGNAKGELVAYKADTGEKIWSFQAGTGIVAPPVTYSVDGVQYVTVMAGWGGAFPLVAQAFGVPKRAPALNRVLTFAIDGTASLSVNDDTGMSLPEPPARFGTAEQLQKGNQAYYDNCVVCHGISMVASSSMPDLRVSAILDDAALWQSIVHDGALKENGMIAFSKYLSPEDIEAVRAYIVDTAHVVRERMLQDEAAANAIKTEKE